MFCVSTLGSKLAEMSIVGAEGEFDSGVSCIGVLCGCGGVPRDPSIRPVKIGVVN